MIDRSRTPSSCAVVVLAVLLAGKGTTSAADWHQWAGPHRDFTTDDAGLAESWPEGGPPVLWQRAIGEGYAGVVTSNGKVFTGHRDGEQDVWIALDAASGETVWEFRHDAPVYEEAVLQFGKGPNATPLVVGDRLITVSYAGLVPS